jgi:L-ascorbate metabolism protein UlaG (beta-lactamase superfamily)
MKQPHLQDDAFLADVADVAGARHRSSPRASPADPMETPADPALHLWWLGQSGFLVFSAGRQLLLDPYLSDSLTRKYAGTDKPHVRLTKRVIAPERLHQISVVTSSHGHTDHLDPDTLRALAGTNPDLQLVCPLAHVALARERSGLSEEHIHGLDPAANPVLELAGFRFHAVPAAHETLEFDGEGRHLFVGYVVEVNGFRVYHSGDTVPYDGITEILRQHAIDVALLPINGRLPARRVAGNLWGREAAQLAKDIHARMAVPCHYDLFEFNTASPDEFAKECIRLGQPYQILRQGERLSLPKPAARGDSSPIARDAS